MKCFKIILILFFLNKLTFAQFIIGTNKTSKHTVAGDGTNFSKSQFWLGIKGGVNLSWATVGSKYQIFQPLPSATTFNYEKDYDGIQFPGFQSGMQIIYNFRSFFSIVFEPSYSIQRFAYQNNFSWNSTEPKSEINLSQKIVYATQYLDFPIYLRIDLFKNNARPYLMGGIQYSYMTHASRKSEFTSSENLTGAQNIIENLIPEMSTTNLFIRSNFWYVFGGGISYDIQNIRIGISTLYRASLNNITSEANRFESQKINATGDVLDNINLRNIEISLYCVFPMKFITSANFKHVNP